MSNINIADIKSEVELSDSAAGEVFGGRRYGSSPRGQYLRDLAAWNNSQGTLFRAQRRDYQAQLTLSRLSHAKQTELAFKYGVGHPRPYVEPKPSYGQIRLGTAPGWTWSSNGAVRI